MQLQYFVRPQSRNGKQLQHAFRHFFAQLVEARMRPGLVELGDDVGNRAPDTGNLGKRACCDDAF